MEQKNLCILSGSEDIPQNSTEYPTLCRKQQQLSLHPKGKKEVRATINYYMNNAKILRESLVKLGFQVFGGVNAPYVWVNSGRQIKSWDLFDKLLNEAHVVGTPGSGFGPSVKVTSGFLHSPHMKMC